MSKENPVIHYDFDGISPLEIFKVLEKKDQMTNYEAFCRFNAIKYIWRYPQKNGKDDLEKARDYLRLLIKEKYPEDKTYLDTVIDYILKIKNLLEENECKDIEINLYVKCMLNSLTAMNESKKEKTN